MSDVDEDWDRLLGPAGRSRTYKAQAEALEAELAASTLPNEREKLRAAVARFRELAEAEDRVLQRKRERADGGAA